MIVNFVKHRERTQKFINLGDEVEVKFINDKFNFYSDDKKINFYKTNGTEGIYDNLGDEVTAEEVNDIINNQP